jgi:PPP family 3-phenylpropionic acid transporter
MSGDALMNARWRLSAWYFMYFAFIGAYLPYFGLYLESLNLSPTEIGILMSLGQVVRMLVPALWGWLSDRSGRRAPIVRASAVFSFVSFGTYFFSDSLVSLLGATLLLHLFWSGALPLVEALTFAHLHDDPEAYGRIRLWGSLGFIVAVLGVGVVLDSQSMQSFLWCSWGMLAILILVAWGLQEGPNLPGTQQQPKSGKLTDTRVIVLLVAGFFMAAAHGPLYVFYSIHLVGYGYGKTLAGGLWSIGVVAEILIFLVMPRLSRRFPLKQILVASFTLAVLRFLLIGWWIDSLPWLVFAQVLHGATFGSHHAATVAALNRWFPAGQQGRVQALYGSLSFGAGGMFGALLAGKIWETYDAAVTFSMASGLALIGLLVVVVGMISRETSNLDKIGPVR